MIVYADKIYWSQRSITTLATVIIWVQLIFTQVSVQSVFLSYSTSQTNIKTTLLLQIQLWTIKTLNSTDLRRHQGFRDFAVSPGCYHVRPPWTGWLFFSSPHFTGVQSDWKAEAAPLTPCHVRWEPHPAERDHCHQGVPMEGWHMLNSLQTFQGLKKPSGVPDWTLGILVTKAMHNRKIALHVDFKELSNTVMANTIQQTDIHLQGSEQTCAWDRIAIREDECRP